MFGVSYLVDGGLRSKWLVGLVVVLALLAVACGSGGEPLGNRSVERRGRLGTRADVPAPDLGPVGGGEAGGTGANISLQCPPDIGTNETDWYGPAQFPKARAVRDGFGDYVQDPMQRPSKSRQPTGGPPGCATTTKEA